MGARLIDSAGRMVPEWPLGTGSGVAPPTSVLLAVIGSERSGKSTLLNELLGTSFPVHRQTIGVQAGEVDAVCVSATDTAVEDRAFVALDCGASKSEDLLHKVGMFALAVSDIVVVNMWFHDIGRFRASNHALLCALFQATSQIEDHPTRSKTVMILAIRDAEMETPSGTLQAQVMADLQKLWASVPKSSANTTITLEDIFDISIVMFPHFTYARDGFLEQVRRLKTRLEDVLSNAAIGLPTRELQHYCSRMWESIAEKRAINVLSEQELLAAYLCNQSKSKILQDIHAQLHEAVGKERHGFLPDFAVKACQLVEEGLDVFAKETSWSRKHWIGWGLQRKGLVEGMLVEVSRASELQIPRIKTFVIASFKDALSLLSSLENLDEWASNSIESHVQQARELMRGLQFQPDQISDLLQAESVHAFLASASRQEMEVRSLHAELSEMLIERKNELGFIIVRSRQAPLCHAQPSEREPPPPKFSRALFVPILFFCVAGVLFDNGEFRFDLSKWNPFARPAAHASESSQ
eukprot:tig00021464_g21743.t1